MQPLSPTVSRGKESYNRNSPSASPVTVVRNYSHTCMYAVYSSCGYYLRPAFTSLRTPGPDCAATIRGQRLFRSELPTVQLLFDDYLRAAIIRINTVSIYKV